MTEWSAWTACRVIDHRSCSGPGLRRRLRVCENGCEGITNTNLTITEDCNATEDGFHIENLRFFLKQFKFEVKKNLNLRLF